MRRDRRSAAGCPRRAWCSGATAESWRCRRYAHYGVLGAKRPRLPFHLGRAVTVVEKTFTLATRLHVAQ